MQLNFQLLGSVNILLPFLKGFLINAGLIIGIGAQNAFILQLGVKQHYVFITTTLCVLLDTTLITIGVFGIGFLVAQHPHFLNAIRYAGILFLIGYGLISLRTAYTTTGLHTVHNAPPPSFMIIFLTLLGVSLLNPQVYLDTVFIVGSLGSNYQQSGKILFIIGSVIASTLWFFALGYGGKKFSPILSKKRPWKIVNSITAFIMFAMAVSLVFVKIEI